MASAHTLAGRLRTRFRRIRRGDHREETGAGVGAAAAVGAGAGGGSFEFPEEQEEFLPDLDDCAELSELLMTGEEPQQLAAAASADRRGGAGPPADGCELPSSLGELQQQQQQAQAAVKELQAQLVALAIENEALRSKAAQVETETVAELRRQLAAEREMRLRVEAEGRPVGRIARAVNRLRRRRSAAAAVGAPSGVEPPPEGVDLESLGSASESDEAAGGRGGGGSGGVGPTSDRPPPGFFDRVRAWLAGRILDLAEDLQPERQASQAATTVVEEPLSARRLKANATRFGRCVRPLLRCARGCRDVTRWSSPSYTAVVAATYYFALVNSLMLPLILSLCIARLGLNYLKYRRRWRFEFNFVEAYETQEEEEGADREKTVGTQVNFVVQVARKVQNLTGTLSDNMEKFKNLVTWRSPRHTQSLLNILVAAFAVSLLLPASTCFYCAGLYLGFKLLVVDALFSRYPRLRRRYDGFSRMWQALPTDQQLGRMSAGADVAKYILPYSESGSVASPAGPEGPAGSTESVGGSPMASDDEQFCQVFALPNQERPLSRWRGGKRCAIICKDADRTLPSSLKHGKLFLTRSFLCFERSKDRGKLKKRNLVIPLTMIRWIKKTKPFAWFPGGGMSIDVQIVGVDKPITFSAIIGRDEVFDSLLEAGRKAGLAWSAGETPSQQQQQQQQQPPQQSDPLLIQAVNQALMSDSDLED